MQIIEIVQKMTQLEIIQYVIIEMAILGIMKLEDMINNVVIGDCYEGNNNRNDINVYDI